uniref:Uncharacterized protein n=1 Tax=Fagus sylvatica TaxID=28930 RepID=A0A2N9G049_FAGSY
MADKKSQKPSSSRNPPVKKPTVKPELVTPSQLVTYDPHSGTPINSPVKTSSFRMVAVPPPTAPTKSQYAKPSPYFPFQEFNIVKPDCQIPMWFLKWWSKHGAQVEIIPDVLQDPEKSTKTLRESLLHFAKMYKSSKYNSKSPPILLFCAKFHVPWIVKWHYQIEDNVLIRSYVVKWFDKFDRDRIIGFVYKEFPFEPMKEIEDKQSSPTSSIKDLLKGKSLEELAEIAQMAAIQCRQSASGKHSPASFEGSSTAKLPYALVTFPLKWYQDSHDPYDGYEHYELNLD